MPPQKPTKLKILQGTNRPDREPAYPRPRPIVGDPPRDMPVNGKRMWKQYAARLEELGLASEIDRPALERLCMLHCQIARLEKELLDASLVTEGAYNTMKKDPRVTIYLQLLREYREYLKGFGMLPSARQKLHITDTSETIDEFEEFLSGKIIHHGEENGKQ